MMEKKIAVIGLGYVGLPLAVEFGKVMPTLGFDINDNRINELVNNIDRTNEVTSEEIELSKSLEFSKDEKKLSECNIYIITVPTPIDSVNRPDLSPIISATKMVGKHIKSQDIIIYESTVYPGCTEEICVPILEETSGLNFNKDFYCGYSPERINPGDKVNTITKIKKITSGSNKEVSIEIDNLYKKIITAGTFKAASIKVAEAAKVIENTQRDLNISLVNELSIIFGRLNIDTLDVLEAAGSKWNFQSYRPGLVGGHCIGVDPYYLTHKAEQVGYHPQVILAGRKINDGMAPYMVKKVVQKMINNGIDVSKSTVGVMGITFKENCPDVRNSKIFDVVKELKAWGAEVIINDPHADSDDLKENYNITLKNISENSLDSLIVAVGHNEYRNMNPSILKKLCRATNPVIADVKSIYDRSDLCEQGFSVFRL